MTHCKTKCFDKISTQKVKNDSYIDFWRWKLNRKMADFINHPNEINVYELKSMIDSYHVCHTIKDYVVNNVN